MYLNKCVFAMSFLLVCRLLILCRCVLTVFIPRRFSFRCLGKAVLPGCAFPTHYENALIQIYRKISSQKTENFQIKIKT